MSESKSRNNRHGRGTSSQIPGRFERYLIESVPYEAPVDSALSTEIRFEQARTLISKNDSPDVPFNLSVNPYRGCEHGCIYCFARPGHAYLELSPGLDFETKIIAKINAAEVFEQELRHPRYVCQPIAVGINTDAYQPAEKKLKITRSLLKIALKYKQPVSLITKSHLILRDIDLLQPLAEANLVQVAVSITTLDNQLKRQLEPRAASGTSRLKIVESLSSHGIPVSALFAPVIPFVNDHELESIISACASAGACSVYYISLRLPHEVAPLFEEWLRHYLPERADRVLNRIRDMHQGRLYRSEFGTRMTGTGVYADLIRQRFHLAIKQAGLSHQKRSHSLDVSQFSVPPEPGEQYCLF
ncbi:Radical SAM superfamily protein [Vibrio aerogenes CECT 7868]|uniref:Radical SAM superfamily protein n=1 Tax=Vibrio aerogenes CECT 7868 TaxID=1216006 RepID=A0A1M5WJA8_9VIBR|nr:PA0069 family radical SAM protein [Vibrio aerogenes]SHH87639.1 Radical SAM superfamily protein [Vibrio aerogenes CECT 7868]